MPPARSSHRSEIPGYRPEIDGLRAIAVLAVVLYHFDFADGSLPGGFYGVDIFFVISGYLITHLIIQSENAGSFSYRKFYARRLRRLAPALMVMIVICLMAGYFLLLPGDYVDLASSASYAAIGLSNWHFHGATGYFDQASELMPLLHTWSLAIEEQFYLLWPLLIATSYRIAGRSALMCTMLVAGMLSFVYCVNLVTWDQKEAFYSPLTRGWELIAGAMLVFAKPLTTRFRCDTWMDTAGLMLLAISILTPTDLGATPGWGTLIPVCGTMLLLWPKTRQGLIKRLLTLPVLRYVGLISYSLYLWHWPVLVFGKHYFGASELSYSQSGLLLTLSALASILSYHAVEVRFRTAPTAPFPVRQQSSFAVAILCTLTIVTLGATSIVQTNGLMHRTGQPALMALDRKAMWAWQPTNPVATNFPNQKAFGSEWSQAERRIIIWGDSHAAHMAPLIEELVAQATETLSVMLYTNCPPTVDGEDFPAYNRDEKYNQGCAKTRASMLDYLQEHGASVDRVILAAAWGTRWEAHQNDGNKLSGIAIQHAALQRTLEELDSLQQRVAIIGQVPLWPTDPIPCVASAEANILRSSCKVGLTESALSEAFNVVHKRLESLASSKVTVTLPHQQLCSSERCIVEIGGEFLYRDQDHIRRNLTPTTRYKLARKIKLEQVLYPTKTI